jgi:hypothetical protein
MILLVKHDVRNSPDLKIRESPIGVDKKGPINGLAKNPMIFLPLFWPNIQTVVHLICPPFLNTFVDLPADKRTTGH